MTKALESSPEPSPSSPEPSPRGPTEYEVRLERLAHWLEELGDSMRSWEPPTAEDTAALGERLLEIWKTAGLDPKQGLVRGSVIQRRFQEVLGPFFLQSPIIHRTLTKPRGYAGDFEMMAAIYRRRAGGDTPLGRWLDAWVLEQPGFAAVRNRRDKLMVMLIEEWAGGACRVMNVASGAAPELAEVAQAVPFEEITLLDQDQGALSAAGAALGGRAGMAKVRSWCGSVLSLVRAKSKLQPASQDFIYSIGLYDYLSQRFARSLTERLWEGLAPGGLLVIGNFNGLNPMRYFIEAAMDWYLLYREPSDLLALTEGLPGLRNAEVWTDHSGCLHLLIARKEGQRRPVF